ncbi:hypothetical protein, partial [Rhodoplanes serenus]
PFLMFVSLRLTIGWMRHSFVMMSIAITLLYLFDQRRTWMKTWMVATGLAGVFLFSALSENRSLIADWISGQPTREAVTGQRTYFFD